MTLKELKSHESIDRYITDNNIYITQHFFTNYEIDIDTPGWIFGKHPTHHDKETTKGEMLQDIELANPGSIIPFFHLASGTVGRIENRPTAIIIHVEEKKKQILHQMLKKTYKDKNYYVP